MKQTVIKSIAGLALYALLPTAYSATDWYFTYGAGIVRPEVCSVARINNNSGAASPYNMDIYTSTESNTGTFLFEIGKRWDIARANVKALSLGLQYQYFMPTDRGKSITQNSSPDFLNYHYNLDLSANILMLNAKTELLSWKKITPFIKIGAGLSQIIASGYNETAFSGITARTSPAFKRNVNNQFTYQLGAGINWEVNSNFFASINYLYQPLSCFESGRGNGTWSDGKLKFGKTYANSVYLTITQILAS